MTKLRSLLLKNNKTIHWYPNYLKEGRFGEWLRDVKDWAVSRDRYWGTPLPVWQCSNGHNNFLGSVADLLAQSYSSNHYFIFRHGESQRQIQKIASCWPEPTPLPLTENGKKQVLSRAQKLSQTVKIDLIISSDLLRTKETAQIISQVTGAPIIYDKNLREFNVGEFNGVEPQRYWKYLNSQKNRFSAKPKGGESLISLRRRMYKFITGLDKKYQNKNIILVSHEMPLTMLEKTLQGLSLEEIIDRRHSGQIKKITPGTYRSLDFKQLPFNDDMELDLHRPFIDQINPLCSQCHQPMKRVSPVLDCWLDSGSMPFAQQHWPFEKSQVVSRPPQLYPADFICEAIDQTRGWFYTLLAVATVLGFKAPYKNVISLGHVLDEKGDKMSKSKGNVINPWEIIAKYGADALRWYFYTINEPGDPKLYQESDLDSALKKFLLTYWNCYIFLKTYAPQIKAPAVVTPHQILDRWIIARLARLARETADLMDNYNITTAVRGIESFTINDLSLWYVRRARRRLQQPQNRAELTEAARIYAYVMENLSRIIAPFAPFLAEEVYQGLSGNNYAHAQSVHLQAWPTIKTVPNSSILETSMAKVRELVATALAQRAQHGIKIRQPLAKITIGGKIKPFSLDLQNLLAQEINVKKIEFNPKLNSILELDWNITPELHQEGNLREIIRNIQELRKNARFIPSDKITIFLQPTDSLLEIIQKNQHLIMRETKAAAIKFAKPAALNFEKSVTISDQPLWLGIKKC